MKNKGFTLIELLAVIVVLGVIMTIAGVSVMKIRNDAALQEAKKLEDTIADLGPGIYSNEAIMGVDGTGILNYDSITINDSKKITLYQLKDYLKELKCEENNCQIKSPFGSSYCEGYLKVTKTEDGPLFKGYISCGDNYETEGYNEQ